VSLVAGHSLLVESYWLSFVFEVVGVSLWEVVGCRLLVFSR